ncbi:hypothetical protein OKW41_009157 [Paraburkholderia sp. UCT70]
MTVPKSSSRRPGKGYESGVNGAVRTYIIDKSPRKGIRLSRFPERSSYGRAHFPNATDWSPRGVV